MKGKRKTAAETKSSLVQAFIDIPTRASLDELARRDDSSLSRIVRQAISEYVERRKVEAA